MTIADPYPSRTSVPSQTMFLAGSAVLFAALCLLFSPFVADDAYIVGRYAVNAAEGQGLVYNIGERVSALTSPLHALLETLLAVIGLDPVAGYRVLSPIMVLAGWYMAQRQAKLGGQALVLFTALSLGSPFLALWTVGGLETPLLACLAVLFLARLVAMCRREAALAVDFLWLGLLAGLMFTTRYDSVLVTVPPLLAIVAVAWRRPGMWAGAAVSLAVAGGWLGFAALYYGDIFPTSYYVKLALGGRAPIDSISATLNFFCLSGLPVAAVALRMPRMADLPLMARAVLRGGVISTALFVFYATQASGQHMMFGYRLFVPWLMVAALLMALALPTGRRWLGPAVLAWQAAMVAVVTFWGVNPAPLTRLPGLNLAYAEYEFVTPRTYGAFMDMLEQDARDMAAHWRENGDGSVPKIYLRTGGTGYWMPEFYVYETLVSYRHGCGEQLRERVGAAHYVQQLGFSRTDDLVERLGRERPDIGTDAPLQFLTVMDWMGPKATGYLYGPDPLHLTLGRRIDGGCAVGR